MKTKKFYTSKEVWVLGGAVMLGLGATYFGWEFTGILSNVENVWIVLAPAVALFFRLFHTQDKIVF